MSLPTPRVSSPAPCCFLQEVQIPHPHLEGPYPSQLSPLVMPHLIPCADSIPLTSPFVFSSCTHIVTCSHYSLCLEWNPSLCAKIFLSHVLPILPSNPTDFHSCASYSDLSHLNSEYLSYMTDLPFHSLYFQFYPSSLHILPLGPDLTNHYINSSTEGDRVCRTGPFFISVIASSSWQVLWARS